MHLHGSRSKGVGRFARLFAISFINQHLTYAFLNVDRSYEYIHEILTDLDIDRNEPIGSRMSFSSVK